MTTIRMETIGEEARQFLRQVSQYPAGVVIEEDGQPVYRIIPYPLPADNGASEPVHIVES